MNNNQLKHKEFFQSDEVYWDLFCVLSEKKDAFFSYLMYIAELTNFGFEYENSLVGNKGDFTGKHLCAIANGALLEAIGQLFGDDLDLYWIRIVTTYMDQQGNLLNNIPRPHQIARAKSKKAKPITIDATITQFVQGLDAETILFIPTNHEYLYYAYPTLYRTASRRYLPQYELGRKMLRAYQTRRHPPHELFQLQLEKAKKGELGNCQPFHLWNLVQVVLS